VERAKLTVVPGIPAAEAHERLRKAVRAGGSLVPAAQYMGFLPEGQSYEEFAAAAKRRFARDWQQSLAKRSRFPRLRWALRRVWPIR
jgi:hypothetical protein